MTRATRHFPDYESASEFAKRQTLESGVGAAVSRASDGWVVEYEVTSPAQPGGGETPPTNGGGGEKPPVIEGEIKVLTPTRIEIVVDGKTYKWFEKGGITDARYVTPPQVEAEKVRLALAPHVKKFDLEVKDPSELLQRATRAKNDNWHARCLWIADHMLALDPGNESAAVMQSSALRDLGRAEDAVAATEPFERSGGCALLTTRAAALLDVGRRDEAIRCAKRAWAQGCRGPELSRVFSRIESGKD